MIRKSFYALLSGHIGSHSHTDSPVLGAALEAREARGTKERKRQRYKADVRQRDKKTIEKER